MLFENITKSALANFKKKTFPLSSTHIIVHVLKVCIIIITGSGVLIALGHKISYSSEKTDYLLFSALSLTLHPPIRIQMNSKR